MPFLELFLQLSILTSSSTANIIFDKKVDTPIVIGPAIILASSNAVLNDVTGKSITINIRHR